MDLKIAKENLSDYILLGLTVSIITVLLFMLLEFLPLYFATVPYFIHLVNCLVWLFVTLIIYIAFIIAE